MAVDVGSAVGHLDLDISKFLSGLKSAQDESEKTSKTITGKLDSIGGKLSSTGSKMTALVTTPIAGAGTFVTKTAAKFESAMSKVSAISGATGDDLDALTKKAEEMGENTKFSASESAEAFQYMAMAGWKTEDMLDGIDGIMNLAAADGLDLATTSDIVTDALTAFGLNAKDSGHFADILAAASTNANTNVSMLGESFKYVAPLAGAMKYSAEDVGVALGLMANAGIKGSQAGTALRSAITKMVKPTEDAAMWMERLGISVTNEDGTMKSLSEVMNILREKMGGLTEEEQGQAAATMFGQEAMSGMLAIVNASPQDYEKLTEALANTDGTAKNMADTMNNNLSGQLVLLKSQIEGVAINLGNLLMPVIKKVVSKISEWVDWFSKLSESQQKTILKIAAVVAAIGPLLLIIGKVITIISTVINVVKTLKTVVLALHSVLLANPIALVIAAVAALIAIFVVLWNKCEGFRDFWKGLWEEIKNTVWRYLDVIVGFFSSAWDAIKFVWDFVKFYFEAIWDAITGVFSGAASWFKTVFKNAYDNIKSVFSGIGNFFSGIWENIKNIFSNVGTAVGDAFSGAFKTVVNTIFEWIENRINDFIGMINGAVSVINNIPGVDIGEIDYLSLPRLAKGGLAYSPTAAIVGDNKNASVDPEVISPLSKLKSLIASSVVIDITPLVSLLEQLVDVQKSVKSHNLPVKNNSQGYQTEGMDGQTRNSSGDTFNFYSSKQIDEEEAANQIKRIKREIEEGF